MKPSSKPGQRSKLESHAELIMSEVSEILGYFQEDSNGLIRQNLTGADLNNKLATLKILSVGPFKELLDVFIENLRNGSMVGRTREDVSEDILYLREKLASFATSEKVELPSSFDPLLDAVSIEVNKRIGAAMAGVLDEMGIVGVLERIKEDNARLRGENYRFRKEIVRLSAENAELAALATDRRPSDLEVVMNETFGPLAILGFSDEAELSSFVSDLSDKEDVEKKLMNRGRILWHEDKIASLSDSLPLEIHQELLTSYRAKFRNVSLAIKEVLTQKRKARSGVLVQNEWMNYRPQ